MSALEWYFLAASVVGASSVVLIPPTHSSEVGDFFASAAIGLALGWLLWPVFVYALWRYHRDRR